VAAVPVASQTRIKKKLHVRDVTTCASCLGKYIIIIILNANRFSPGGSVITIRHNTQITHIVQVRKNKLGRKKNPS
jgi:hypothetical protein